MSFGGIPCICFLYPPFWPSPGIKKYIISCYQWQHQLQWEFQHIVSPIWNLCSCRNLPTSYIEETSKDLDTEDFKGWCHDILCKIVQSICCSIHFLCSFLNSSFYLQTLAFFLRLSKVVSTHPYSTPQAIPRQRQLFSRNPSLAFWSRFRGVFQRCVETTFESLWQYHLRIFITCYPKRKRESIPTIHFQVRTVSFRERRKPFRPFSPPAHLVGLFCLQEFFRLQVAAHQKQLPGQSAGETGPLIYPKDPGMSQERDFPYNPILGIGFRPSILL